MMQKDKIVALDLGDRWTGVALSDSTRSWARPHDTYPSKELIARLEQLFNKEDISLVVVGHPRTMKGTASDQTRSVEAMFAHLQAQFPHKQWVLWDERLSSKRAAAQTQGKKPTKELRLKEQAIAAAFILDSYLTFLKVQQTP